MALFISTATSVLENSADENTLSVLDSLSLSFICLRGGILWGTHFTRMNDLIMFIEGIVPIKACLLHFASDLNFDNYHY